MISLKNSDKHSSSPSTIINLLVSLSLRPAPTSNNIIYKNLDFPIFCWVYELKFVAIIVWLKENLNKFPCYKLKCQIVIICQTLTNLPNLIPSWGSFYLYSSIKSLKSLVQSPCHYWTRLKIMKDFWKPLDCLFLNSMSALSQKTFLMSIMDHIS